MNYFYAHNMNAINIKEFEFIKKMIEIAHEMKQANTITNYYDANAFINNIINKYSVEFYIYDNFNPINNYPPECRVMYIKQFLFSIGFKELYDHRFN